MNLEINFDELKKKNYEEIATLTIKLIDEHIDFETKTKAELIKLMAEKLYEAKYPQYEIRSVIEERLGDRVTRQYLLRCLDERFKKPAKVAAGKQTAEKRASAKKAMTNTGSAGSATVLEEPEQDLDGDSDEYQATKRSLQRDELPKTEYNNETEREEEVEEIEEIDELERPKYSERYVSDLRKQFNAKEEDTPYQDCLGTIRVVKAPKQRSSKLEEAISKAKNFTVLLIDIRTNELVNAYTDSEWKKQTTYKKTDQ